MSSLFFKLDIPYIKFLNKRISKWPICPSNIRGSQDINVENPGLLCVFVPRHDLGYLGPVSPKLP